MELHELEKLVRDGVSDVDLRPEEIPSIDLYVDQITSLTTEKLNQGAERFRDRVLTKTMINNYSKDGLISPIKGKKYSKNHIVQMLLVYSLKNTLSIGEINRILQTVYAQPDYTPEMLEDTYRRFLEIKDLERQQAWDGFCGFVEQSGLDISNDTDYLALILSLASASSYLKTVTQALLEAKYPEIDPEREQRERDELKKQKKEDKKESKKEKKESKEAKKEAADAKEQA
jgi:hypothetical protein